MFKLEKERSANKPQESETPDYAENFNLESIVTPVKVKQLIAALRRTNYNKDEIRFLEEGFTHGFDIEYGGPLTHQSESPNLPLRVGNKTQLWNKIIKEVSNKRVAGPYDSVPFDNYI